jgi:hypothetical protein
VQRGGPNEAMVASGANPNAIRTRTSNLEPAS